MSAKNAVVSEEHTARLYHHDLPLTKTQIHPQGRISILCVLQKATERHKRSNAHRSQLTGPSLRERKTHSQKQQKGAHGPAALLRALHRPGGLLGTEELRNAGIE